MTPCHKHIFLIASKEPWYGDILVYIQTRQFHSQLSCDELQCIGRHATRYLIIGDVLYYQGFDLLLRQCLTHKEVEQILNDCQNGAYGSHLSRMETTKNFFCMG